MFPTYYKNILLFSLLIVRPCICPVYNALYLSICCSLDFLTLYLMQAAIATQISPADSNEIMRTTMMMVVVLSFGVTTVLDGMLVGVLGSV